METWVNFKVFGVFGLTLVFALLQQAPHHLARAALGQAVGELHQARHLVGGHVLARPGDDVVLADLALKARAQHHHGLDGLAALLADLLVELATAGLAHPHAAFATGFRHRHRALAAARALMGRKA